MAALEPLLLRDAESLAARVQEADRGEIARALALGRQKVRAADALWSNGHVAEGLRLAREALDATLAATPAVARALGGDPGDLRAQLARRGLGERAIARVLEARERAAPPTPARDREIARAHADLYDLFQLARRDVDRALDPAGRTPRAIRLARAGRIAALALVALAAVGLVALASRRREGIHAEASAQFGIGREFAPANAIDGLPEREWLLPDRTGGSLEITLEPPRRIERVLLTNCHNPPYRDRAAREVRIDALSSGRVVRTATTTFEAIEPAPRPRAVAIGADGVDRIRIVIVSWHATGGGLAEVALE